MGKGKRIDGQRGFDAVLALLRREASASKIARDYRMSEQTLYRLREKFLQGGKTAILTNGKSTPDGELNTLRREVAERDRVIGEITIANRILKKTADGLL